MKLITIVLFVILIVIAWAFFSLAKKYKKSTVYYVTLGLVSFIFIFLLNAFIYSLFTVVSDYISLDNHRIVAILMGIFSVFILYIKLEKRWLKNYKTEAEKEINEIGKE